jgi:hypothetical protein
MNYLSPIYVATFLFVCCDIIIVIDGLMDVMISGGSAGVARGGTCHPK